mgnify:CR=1 FL=1
MISRSPIACSGDIDPGVVCETRLLHVDDVDIDTSIRAASMARAAGIPITSDIEQVGERTEELVAAVTIPIFAEHVLEPLTGERDFERALRKLRQRHAGMLCVTLGARGAMLLDGDELYYTVAMAAVGQELTHHLEATLKRQVPATQ